VDNLETAPKCRVFNSKYPWLCRWVCWWIDTRWDWWLRWSVVAKVINTNTKFG